MLFSFKIITGFDASVGFQLGTSVETLIMLLGYVIGVHVLWLTVAMLLFVTMMVFPAPHYLHLDLRFRSR